MSVLLISKIYKSIIIIINTIITTITIIITIFIFIIFKNNLCRIQEDPDCTLCSNKKKIKKIPLLRRFIFKVRRHPDKKLQGV